MKKHLAVLTMIILFLMCASLPCAAGEWRIPFGVTYLNGWSDLFDQMEDNMEAGGADVDAVEGIPLGLVLQPYYEYDSGLGIGFGFGPFTYIFGDIDYFGLPVNVCLRYAFTPRSNITPYIRVGAAMQIANGDYVEHRNVGMIGALGVELMRDRKVSLGLEAGYDGSSVEVEDRTTSDPDDTEDIEPVGFMISIVAVF